MAKQASITSFFSPPAKKLKAQPPEVSGTAQNAKAPEPVSEIKNEPESPVRPGLPAAGGAERAAIGSFRRGQPVDPAFLERNAERHLQFVQKIGRPKPRGAGQPQARKLTKLDEQYIELKRSRMDTILIMEVGYKYKIFARDAQVAARAFGWTLVSGWMNLDEGDPVDALYSRFAVCSFPVARLDFYVQKLVAKGHKVGVVNQMETSALKAVGDNKRGPFRREVTAVYTRGTYIDDVPAGVALSGHILALRQTKKPSGSEFALLSVQPATGDIIYDEFSDTDICTELETRLLHIQPCEVLILGALAPEAARLVDQVATRGNARVTKVDEAVAAIEFENLQSLPAGVKQCAAALISYLEEFELEKVFNLNPPTPFTLASHMRLNGNTLTSLEIFQNSTDYKTKGSLFWVLDNTRTPFGQRLLKKWVAQPLLDREMLSARCDAVQELCTSFGGVVEQVTGIMTQLPDFERALLQIHYGRISPKQLYWTLFYFQKVSAATTIPEIQHARFKSPVLQELFEQLPVIRDSIEGFLKELQPEPAKLGDKLKYFVAGGQSPERTAIEARKDDLELIDGQFQEFLSTEKQRLGIALAFVSIAGDDYLVEVRQSDIKKVPTGWRKMNGTKACSRYRTPETLQLIKDLQLAQERHELACDTAFKAFVQDISKQYNALRSVVMALANLDCLMSLAGVSAKQGYVRVDYVDEPCIEITEGRHPMIEEIMEAQYIPNSVSMYPNKSRTMIVTGPNMGGKSSFVRQTALIAIMGQIGSFVPARRARLSLMDAVYTRMGAYDNMMRGESTFMVELKECSDILAAATPKSLVLLDEIGRGTGTTDGMAIAYAVLDYMVSDIQSFTLFVTHYPLLTELAKQYPHVVTNWCMGHHENQDTKQITFLYSIQEKAAERSYGLNVARLAHIEPSIIAVAEKKSLELERALTLRRQGNKLLQLLTDITPAKVQELRASSPFSPN